MPDFSLRHEQAGDAEEIFAVTEQAFQNAAHADGREPYIVNALRDAGALSVSVVAQCKGEIIGHVALSPVTINAQNHDWFGLGPISVRPDWQGQGVGSALMQQALAELRDHGAAGCVLLGEPAFYRRFGFKSVAGLELPGLPPEYFLALPIRGHPPRGQVAYHPAFEVSA